MPNVFTRYSFHEAAKNRPWAVVQFMDGYSVPLSFAGFILSPGLWFKRLKLVLYKRDLHKMINDRKHVEALRDAYRFH